MSAGGCAKHDVQQESLYLESKNPVKKKCKISNAVLCNNTLFVYRTKMESDSGEVKHFVLSSNKVFQHLRSWTTGRQKV